MNDSCGTVNCTLIGDELLTARMDGIGGGGGGNQSDAVTVMPTPDNSIGEDVSYSRTNSQSDNTDTIQFNTPLSNESSQLPPLQSSQSLPHLSQSMSPPPSNQQRLPSLPALPPLSPSHYVAPQNPNTSWSQMRSPTSAPSNPFYSSTYRSSTPPLPSSAEESPLVSPAKRFSSGEVKPPFSPNSPRTPLNEEDRAKFAQVYPSPRFD